MKKIELYSLAFMFMMLPVITLASAPASNPHLVASALKAVESPAADNGCLKISVEKPVSANDGENINIKDSEEDPVEAHGELVFDMTIKLAMSYQYPTGPAGLMMPAFKERIEADKIYINFEKERLLRLLKKRDESIADDGDSKPDFELKDALTERAKKKIQAFLQIEEVRMQNYHNKLRLPKRAKSPKSS